MLLVEILIPAQGAFGVKKSKILLLSMLLPVLLFGLADPTNITHLLGRLAPAGPRSLFEIVLPLFAPPVEVLIKTLPVAAVFEPVDEPRILQFVITLFCAPLIRRIVLVPVVAAVCAFVNVNELPPELRPSIVMLSAPLRSINGAASAPETVLPPEGVINTEEYDDNPVPLAFSAAETVSTVSQLTTMLIAPWCVPALIASNAALSVA